MAKDLDLSENLKIDYRLAVGSCELDNDYIEGVRALLVDKDNAPKWVPLTLESVHDLHLEQFFKPLPTDLNVVSEKKSLFDGPLYNRCTKLWSTL